MRDKDGVVGSTLKTTAGSNPTPALEFFTQFVNPTDPNYSWNRGLANSKAAFLSGSLATYFGFASELFDLRAKNPNLNFDAALMPQLRKNGFQATYGRMYGLSMVRSTPNPSGVYQILTTLTSPQYLSRLSETMYLPPVRRDLLTQGSKDPYITIFGQAALDARSWLDADPAKSQQIMADMTSSITSGSKTVSQAIQDAGAQHDVVLEQSIK
jgi:ABC-type glycerol-3-phosphate transport system substrate-binding protein